MKSSNDLIFYGLSSVLQIHVLHLPNYNCDMYLCSHCVFFSLIPKTELSHRNKSKQTHDKIFWNVR